MTPEDRRDMERHFYHRAGMISGPYRRPGLWARFLRWIGVRP